MDIAHPHYLKTGGEKKMAQIYLDFDMCAFITSYRGELDISTNGGHDKDPIENTKREMERILRESFSSDDLRVILPVFLAKIAQLKEFMEFMEKNHVSLTILTMNSENNVKWLLEAYDLPLTPTVSILDLRASNISIPPNLFSAVLGTRKGKKTIDAIAKIFKVEIEDIKKELLNPAINKTATTKATWAAEQRKPFLFLDDSEVEIGFMDDMIGKSDNADIKNSQTIQIFRPKRRQDKRRQDIMLYGMFSNQNTLHEIGIVERVKQALTAINGPDGAVPTTEGKEEGKEEVSTYRTFYL